MSRRHEAPFDPAAPKPRLPVLGGPLDGKSRPAEGMRFSRKSWTGEYRRTATAWQWTPPAGKEDPVTDVVSSIGLVSHPSPKVMADHAENVASRVRRDGTQVMRRATVLAVRGLPNGTAGNGSRSSDTTTSVERSAGLAGEPGDEQGVILTPAGAEWLDVDADLARLHREWWALGDRILALYDRIQSHASDDDPIPAGTGSCRRCGQFWRPTTDRPNDRIKAGYGAPCCYMKWVRAGRPDRTMFDRTSDEDLTALCETDVA